MDIYRECRTYEEFIQRMKKFAKLNGLHLKYRTDFLDEITYISLASCNLGRNREYRIPWREVTDISDTIKAITDDVCKAFNLRKEKESVNHSVNTTTSSKPTSLPEIKKVIYNDPATIVFWTDGTKTVVKCHSDDEYSKYTGLAWCIAKKALGNNANYIDIFKKWVPEDDEESQSGLIPSMEEAVDRLADLFNRLYVTNYKETKTEDKEKTVKKVCRNCKFYDCWYFEHPCSECVRNLDHSGARDYWTSAK